MKSGRASSDDIRDSVTNLPERPSPPAELSSEEQSEWRKLVDSCPANYFEPKHHPSMVSYCRHVARGSKLSRVLNDMNPADDQQVQDYKRIHSMIQADSKAALSFERSFRLTHQSQRDRAKKTPTGGLRDRF